MRTFAEAWSSADGIEGWLAECHARMLYDAASAVAPGAAIVEIGSHHGRSTVVLVSAKPVGTRLLAVDPYGDPRWGPMLATPGMAAPLASSSSRSGSRVVAAGARWRSC